METRVLPLVGPPQLYAVWTGMLGMSVRSLASYVASRRSFASRVSETWHPPNGPSRRFNAFLRWAVCAEAFASKTELLAVPGDSDFIYTMSVSDQGFELGYLESVLLDSGRRENSSSFTLVRCEPEGSEADSESQDDEALALMREHAEMIAGRSFDDHEWQAEVEAASENPDIDVPNGIETWLEMLPVDDDGNSPESVVVRWGI